MTEQEKNLKIESKPTLETTVQAWAEIIVAILDNRALSIDDKNNLQKSISDGQDKPPTGNGSGAKKL